jgi:hypothetical protein
VKFKEELERREKSKNPIEMKWILCDCKISKMQKWRGVKFLNSTTCSHSLLPHHNNNFPHVSKQTCKCNFLRQFSIFFFISNCFLVCIRRRNMKHSTFLLSFSHFMSDMSFDSSTIASLLNNRKKDHFDEGKMKKIGFFSALFFPKWSA